MMIRNKRKGNVISSNNNNDNHDDDDDDDDSTRSVFDQIKRFRITYTPGELRLANDLKEIECYGLENIEINFTDDPSSIIIHFIDEMTSYKPSIFSIKVPRHYPHNHPTVMCLQEQYILPCCTFLQSNGMIIHPELVENWDALKSTIHVIKIIANIRSSYDVKNMTAPLDNMVNDTVMTNDNIDIKHKFTDITSITENDNTTDDDEMSV